MAPLAREAAPITLPDAPVEPEPPHADTEEHRSLTRREIRQRERLRTASVPVITSEVLAATRVSEEPEAASHDESPAGLADEDDVIHAEVVTDAIPATPTEDDWSAPHDDAHDGSPAEPAWSAPVAPVEATSEVSSDIDATADASSGSESLADSAQPSDADTSGQPESEPAAQGESAGKATTEADRRVVAPTLGSDLLDGHAQNVEVPASFDQLLTRGATGALSMPNALILSQTPDGGSLTSPVAATGEILITGTFALPDHYGSTGTVPGRADGKEADAVLVDGELPAASSPTPIAASAAISTIKSADEIIKPPAPERGSRLMVVLAITAGVLAVALAGVLILAITTGIFS